MFRVVVTSSDGHRCGVPVQVDDHPGEPRSYQINQIANSLLIRHDEIRDVLASGTHEQLKVHLSRFTKEQLKPLRIRREGVARHSFWGDSESG